MFEISVASKYLLPRWRQLSISIISCISVLVISLVVWLIVVFFSVTDSLESTWIRKLTSLTAPVRVTPTEAYYQSYYYLADSISHQSDYSPKSIHEKKIARMSDPYDPEVDQEIPDFWPEPDRFSDGSLKDPVKLAYAAIAELPSSAGVKADDFELTMTHIRLNLIRPSSTYSSQSFSSESVLSYPTFLGHFAGGESHWNRLLMPIQTDDINNVFYQINQSKNLKQIVDFWHQVDFTALETPSTGWQLPFTLLPNEAEWVGVMVKQGDLPVRVYLPQQNEEVSALKESLESQGKKAERVHLIISNGKLDPRYAKIPLYLAGNIKFPATLYLPSIENPQNSAEIKASVKIRLQGTFIEGLVSLQSLLLADGKLKGHQTRFWQEPGQAPYILPMDSSGREGILLPKNFREVGARVGDVGSLSYIMPTPSTLHEQQLPVYVAGFYDPGIIPIGGKFIIANRPLTSLIRSAQLSEETNAGSNGINLHFDRLEDAPKIKNQLLNLLKEKGVDRYWKVETFRDFEFAQGILQELQSQKTIFTLIAVVIILVACSNIISMLIILVNDKKVEIGILRSMGASSSSIALIFGLAGGFIGLFSSFLGVSAALMTLNHLPLLMKWIGHFQGIDIFQSAFYGESPPQELSYSALSFVLMATILISLLAGIAPAIKACLVRPSQILRSGGA